MHNPITGAPKAPTRIIRENGRAWLPEDQIILDRPLYKDLLIDRSDRMQGSPSRLKSGLVATGLLTLWLNGVAVKERFSDDMYRSHKPLVGLSDQVSENKALKDLVKDVAGDVCHTIRTPEFMGRFFKIEKDGTKSLNLGAVLAPLSAGIIEKCKRLMVVEVTLPSEFSRKFANIKSLTPEQEVIIIDELVKLLKEKMSDRIVIQNSWDALEIYAVNSGKYFDLKTGKISFNLNEPSVRALEMTGQASDEAEISGGAKSIGRQDRENTDLAKQRLDDVYRVAKIAFERAGISRDVIENIKLDSLEKVLNVGEVAELGKIADKIFPPNTKQNYEKVFELIKAFNANDQRVTAYFIEHKAEENLFKSLVSGQRGVKLKLEMDADFDVNHIYTLITPIPLLLALSLLYNLLTIKKRRRYAKEFERLVRLDNVVIG